MTTNIYEIEEAIKDGLSNVTGEWFNDFIVPGLSLTEKQSRDLLFYSTKAKRLHKNIESLIKEAERKARISERNEVALDNYRGHTFSDSTNYEAKFAKFIDNNEKRINELKKAEL